MSRAGLTFPRSKAFYRDVLGFVEDVDVQPADGIRVVQLTPPGSACSVTIGTGLPVLGDIAPAVRGLHLVVADIENAWKELADRGSTSARSRMSAASGTRGSRTRTATV